MVLYYLIKRKNRIPLTISAVIGSILLNGIFGYCDNLLKLPVFLDSIFTIMTAALFGMWPSIAVGLLTNGFLEVLFGFPGFFLPFTAVNLLTALTTAWFVQKKWFETATHAFWLIITLSFVNSLSGALIVTFIYGGYTNLSLDDIVKGLTLTGKSIFSSAFTVRLVVNIVDKGIAVLPTFFLYKHFQKKAARRN